MHDALHQSSSLQQVKRKKKETEKSDAHDVRAWLQLMNMKLLRRLACVAVLPVNPWTLQACTQEL